MRYYEYILQKGREMDSLVKPEVGSKWVAIVDYPNCAIVQVGDIVEITWKYESSGSSYHSEIEYTNTTSGDGGWIGTEETWHNQFRPLEQSDVDNVNSPSHYGNGSIECIDYIKDFLNDDEYQGYLRGNIAKYLHRWPYKNGVEDLKKAQVYLTWLIGHTEETKDD